MSAQEFAGNCNAWIDAVTSVVEHAFLKISVIAAAVLLWLRQQGLAQKLDAHAAQLAALQTSGKLNP